MSSKFLVENNVVKLSGRKFLLTTTLTMGSKKIHKESIYDAILTIDKLGDDVYAYALDGYNHCSGHEFSTANIVDFAELQVRFAKYKINFKKEEKDETNTTSK